jgi:hypothetical protein
MKLCKNNRDGAQDCKTRTACVMLTQIQNHPPATDAGLMKKEHAMMGNKAVALQNHWCT